jgi:hypothetical protein
VARREASRSSIRRNFQAGRIDLRTHFTDCPASHWLHLAASFCNCKELAPRSRRHTVCLLPVESDSRMPYVLSGTVREVGDGFIVLGTGIRITVSSQVRPEGLAEGDRVNIAARLRGAEWVAEDIQVN